MLTPTSESHPDYVATTWPKRPFHSLNPVIIQLPNRLNPLPLHFRRVSRTPPVHIYFNQPAEAPQRGKIQIL